jgi:hypothetical protein
MIEFPWGGILAGKVTEKRFKSADKQSKCDCIGPVLWQNANTDCQKGYCTKRPCTSSLLGM